MSFPDDLKKIAWYYWAMVITVIILLFIVVITSARYDGAPINTIEPYTELPAVLRRGS